jgi:hypothetical protein
MGMLYLGFVESAMSGRGHSSERSFVISPDCPAFIMYGRKVNTPEAKNGEPPKLRSLLL